MPGPTERTRTSIAYRLSQVGHELRTQLTSIIGFADVLERELTGRHRETARLILRSGQRLLRTVNEMLTLSRLEAGRVRLHPEPVDVLDEVYEEVQLLMHQATEKGLGVHVERPLLPIIATVDREAFRRVLENLLSNAIKYTREGQVVVSLRVRGDALVLSVRDTGIGIHADFLPHLFEEFTRQEGGVSDTEGTGLGLAITRRLVELMGGQIAVRSEPGRGSEFTVTLPLHATMVPVVGDVVQGN